MFGNFSLPELLIVGALALIVIGPKDLPRMMRSVGKFIGQARGMARQFQRSMDDAAREVDLHEFRDAQKLLDKETSALNKPLDLLDDDLTEAQKKKFMDKSEMAEAAKDFSDDPAPKAEPKGPETTVPETVDVPEPAEAKQA